MHKLNETPASPVVLTRDEGLQYYRSMQAIRLMEHQAKQLFKRGVIRGGCHLCVGQVKLLLIKIVCVLFWGNDD